MPTPSSVLSVVSAYSDGPTDSITVPSTPGAVQTALLLVVHHLYEEYGEDQHVELIEMLPEQNLPGSTITINRTGPCQMYLVVLGFTRRLQHDAWRLTYNFTLADKMADLDRWVPLTGASVSHGYTFHSVTADGSGNAGIRFDFDADWREQMDIDVRWTYNDNGRVPHYLDPIPHPTATQGAGATPMQEVRTSILQPDGHYITTFRGSGTSDRISVWFDDFTDPGTARTFSIKDMGMLRHPQEGVNDGSTGSVKMPRPTVAYETDRVFVVGAATTPGVTLTMDRAGATLLASRTADPHMSSAIWTFVVDDPEETLDPTVSGGGTDGLRLAVQRSIGKAMHPIPTISLSTGGADPTARWRKQKALPSIAFDSGGATTDLPAWKPETPDLFAMRRTLLGVPHAIPVDLSQATVETGEPLSGMGGTTKTWWYEIDLSTIDSDKVRLSISGTGSLRIAAYHLDPNAFGDVAFATLKKFGDGNSLTITTANVNKGLLYVQVALISGAGTNMVFRVEDVTPGRGGEFASPIPIDGTSGYEAVDTTNGNMETGEPGGSGGLSPVSSVWLAWTSPTPSPGPISFAILPSLGTGDIGLGVYTGSAVNSLSTVATGVGLASAGTSVTFTPTAGTTYWIRVAVEDERRVWEVMWALPAVPVDAATLFDYLRVEAYQKDGLTLISEIPRRRGPTFTEPLNVSGSGQFSIPYDDPLLSQYPGILQTGNIVKMWLGSKCVHGFRIQDHEDVTVGDGEYAAQWTTVSGPSVHFVLDDFMVKHDEKPRPDSPDERAYSWASRPGEWYDPDEWQDQMNADPQDDPPGDKNRQPERRRKYGQPAKWPDKESLWLWVAQDQTRNEGNWKPKRPIKGLKYYRRNVMIGKDGTRVRMFLTSDEDARLYVDGDLILKKSSREVGYKSFVRTSLTLSKGMHTVAIFVGGSEPHKKGSDGVDAMMFTMYAVNEEGDRGAVLLRSNRRWRAWFGEDVPGWNRAQVLRNTWLEARDRKNTTALRLSMGFTGDVDSSGSPWTDSYNQSVRVGMSALEQQQGLSESGRFDVWVDPETLTVHAWKRRGTNKSASVALTPGVNLLDWASKTTDEIKNVFLIKFDGGFTEVRADGSVENNGERETLVELGGVKDAGSAQKLMRKVIRGVEAAIRRAGSPEVVVRRTRERDSGAVIGVHGAYPFLDYGVGDVIAAPNDFGTMVPYRVLALTCTEDDDGLLTFDPELELIGGSIGTGV